jgi:hypothetical protein
MRSNHFAQSVDLVITYKYKYRDGYLDVPPITARYTPVALEPENLPLQSKVPV